MWPMTQHAGMFKSLHPWADTSRSTGQAVVEFALITPLLMAVIMGVFESAVALAANVGVNRAAQGGAHLAAQAGNIVGADCLILDEVEQSVIVPNDRDRIESVRIELTNLDGNTIYASNTWDRSGTTQCVVNESLTLSLPYTRTSNGYPDTDRCNVLAGCPTMTPARTTVDNIAVVVRYNHGWITPLGALVPFSGGEDGSGWTFEQRNIFRMEPHR